MIRSDHRRYKTFVAHRIAELLETTAEGDWRYIPTAENVADDATRAKYPPRYNPASRWLSGPPILFKDERHWPEMPDLQEKDHRRKSAPLLSSAASDQSQL